jgi:hypothetical protein
MGRKRINQILSTLLVNIPTRNFIEILPVISKIKSTRKHRTDTTFPLCFHFINVKEKRNYVAHTGQMRNA